MNTKFENIPELRTDRMILRELRAQDYQTVFKLRSDPLIFKYLPFAPAKNADEMHEYISCMNNNAREGKSVNWGITEKREPNNLVGYTCLFNYEEEARNVEIGYALLPKYQGQGLMNEAARKVCDFAFHIIGARQITAIIHRENKASIQLVELLDFKINASQKEYERQRNELEDPENQEVYSLRNEGYDELPTFKYAPNAVAQDQINRWPGICDVCQMSRNYFYAGPYQSAHPDSKNGTVERYCPWCLANGSLFDAIQGHTVNPELCESVDVEGAIAELTQRTPSYNAWRHENWPSHCGDFCAFESYFDYNSMKDIIPEIQEEWDAAKKEWNLVEEDMVQMCGREGRTRGYLFSCLHCDKKRFSADVC